MATQLERVHDTERMAQATQKRPYLVVTGDVVRTGGMDRANYGLVSWLARSGHRVHVVSYALADELRAEANVIFHRVPKPLRAYTLGAPLLAGIGAAQSIRLGGQGAVSAVVNGGNCPIAATNWVHYVHAAYEPSNALSRGLRMKHLAAHRLALATERVALHRARLVIANSERTKRDVVDRVGVPANRVRIVYYGTDPTAFRPPSADERVAARQMLDVDGDKPIVAFVGALADRRKGFDVLFDAWRQLCSTPAFDAQLVVIGTGDELPLWRARASAEGIEDRIRFLGFRRDVPRILAAIDALVAPTRYEAYGLAVHEALCCGVPALVSRASGVAEQFPIALQSLLIDDPENPEEIASRLRAWWSKASELRAAATAFADHLRERTWDTMAQEITAVSRA